MPPLGPVLVVLVILAVVLAVFVAVIAHAVTRRYWLACAAVTAMALLGCVAWHVADAQINDAASVALLYGIGGATGLGISALAGLPVALVRRARGRSNARLADRWDARERHQAVGGGPAGGKAGY